MAIHRVKKWDGEESVHERVVSFMRHNYPKVIFRTDFAAGIKLPPWLAARQKRLQYKRGFPDLVLFQPSIVDGQKYSGLALELKGKNVKLMTLDGKWATSHFKEQFNMLCELDAQGFACSFGRGFEEAEAVIKWYLDGSLQIDFDNFVPSVQLGEVTDVDEVF